MTRPALYEPLPPAALFSLESPTTMNRPKTLCDIAGHALGGLLANPEWMKWAKEEASKPSNGDVPAQFARIAVKYAERVIEEIESRDDSAKHWLNAERTGGTSGAVTGSA